MRLGFGLALTQKRGAGGGGQTYDAFRAHLASRVNGPELTWFGDQGPSSGQITRKGSGTGLSGAMYDTPWGGQPYLGASFARVMQHSVGSYAEALEVSTDGTEVLFVLQWGGNRNPFYETGRNGYTSAGEDDGSPDGSFRVLECVYWYQGAAWRTYPYGQIAPQPYVF